MKETSLRAAIFEGVHTLNIPPSFSKLNTGRLSNDFSMLTGYSGAMALVNDDGSYDLIKTPIPDVQIPDMTIDDLWSCAKDHYGITALATLSGAAGIPISKLKRGYFVSHGSSKTTNVISHYGYKFFPRAFVPSSMAKSARALFGTKRVFGIVGRSMPFVAVGFAVYDVVSIGMCALEARDGK
ncbi:hypothetical protein [Collimonas antrihumi]|uniref:hypothetical protein n=1 Tax=Collimonas antrihumi TaxID=1940615 RepID=UPI001B8D4ACC|nr:hypothetical protein [Collimonas antrihumi]